jgi:hypothetical protein
MRRFTGFTFMAKSITITARKIVLDFPPGVGYAY